MRGNTLIIVSSLFPTEYSEKILRLVGGGVEISKIPPDTALQGAEAYHPDMILSCVDGAVIASEKFIGENTDFFENLGRYGVEYTAEENPERCGKYPFCVSYNALVTEKFILCNEKAVSKEILKRAGGREVIHVNQGYAACSTLWLGNGAVTADATIAAAFEKRGIDCLKIGEGNIALDEKHYGFIGGASMRISDKVFTFGSLEYHPDCEKILDFLHYKKKDYCPLSDKPLCDFGGAVTVNY